MLTCKIFGHKWSGCKCERCGTTRNDQHDWDLCKGICKRCGKKCAEQHDWKYCKCSNCGIIHHIWNGCRCNRCGIPREIQEIAILSDDEKQHGKSYSREPYKCVYCGKINYRRKKLHEDSQKKQAAEEEQLILAQSCSGHLWVSMGNHPCAYRCKLCGVEAMIHDYDNGKWKSSPSIYSDSTTDEWYEYKCRKCGRDKMGFEEARPINIHATNLRLGDVPGVKNPRDASPT